MKFDTWAPERESYAEPASLDVSTRRVCETVTVRIGVFVALATAIASGQASEVPRFDIVSILGQFVISETVARACAIPDQAETLKFASNRRVVATVAANALRDRNPGLSHEELVTRETQWVKNLVARTSALVAQSSCSSPQIEKLLELYRLQAKMDFSEAQ